MPRGQDGSIIGDATAVSTSTASGIWTMAEVHKYETEDIWPQVGVDSDYPIANGPGGVDGVTEGDYKYHIFTATKTALSGEGFNVTSAGTAEGSTAFDFLVIAGGGSGAGKGTGNGATGGGGAGGYRHSWNNEDSGASSGSLASLTIVAGSYDVTVGAGGPGIEDNDGTVGDDSVFRTITSTGGGKGTGGTAAETGYGSAGGNGHGASGSAAGGGIGGGTAGATGQGTAGGTGVWASPNGASGGGGGAGAAGGNYILSGLYGGAGGAGLTSTIAPASGTHPQLRGGGGGGGIVGTGTPGTASHGGGAGRTGPDDGYDGAAFTGGGGGGTGGTSVEGATVGGNGGGGVVIIRYRFRA